MEGENCNNPPKIPEIGTDEDELSAVNLLHQVDIIRRKIGKYGNHLTQDGSQSWHITRSKVFYSEIYMVVEGERTLLRRSRDLKKIEEIILATVLHLKLGDQWAKENPMLWSVEADITVRWWKHEGESRPGRVANDKMEQKDVILITLSTANENFVPKRAEAREIEKEKVIKEKVVKEKKADEDKRGAPPPSYKESRKHALDKVEPDPKEVTKAKKQKKKTMFTPEDVMEDPGLEPAEELGEEVYWIWKKKKEIWSNKMVDEAARIRGLKPKKMDAPNPPEAPQ